MIQQNQQKLNVWVNGREYVVDQPKPEMTLIVWLRNELHLTGTKLGCAEGGCGSCTVMVEYCQTQSQSLQMFEEPERDRNGMAVHRIAVNACLAPLLSMHNKHVITVEGIGSVQRMHPVQARLSEKFASQCGYCTPGFVMSLYAHLRNRPHSTALELEQVFDGNLCRCTGYRPILDAAKSFASACPMGANCCKMQGGVNSDAQFEKSQWGAQLVKTSDRTQSATETDSGVEVKGHTGIVQQSGDQQEQRVNDSEVIFPPQLLVKLQNEQPRDVEFISERIKWFAPITLKSLLKRKFDLPSSKIVGGNTEIGIETKFKGCEYESLIYSMNVAELQYVTVKDEYVEFGASLTLSKLEESLQYLILTTASYKTETLKALNENLRWFAGRQIRNVATLAGNIATASPISDLNPVLVAVGARLLVQELGKSARIIEMRNFFLGYRKTALDSREVIVGIQVPFSVIGEYCMAFKQSKRRDDDIAIVTAGMKMKLTGDASNYKIENLALAFGGMGPTTVQALQVSDSVRGKLLNDESILQQVIESITNVDLPLEYDAVGGMAQYRRTLAISFFFKFYMNVKQRCNATTIDDINEQSTDKATPFPVRERPLTSARHHIANSTLTEMEHVGQSKMHLSAVKQVTGQALYVDDMPKLQGELYAGLVMATPARAIIKSVNVEEALLMPGVVSFVDHNDVRGHHMIGPVFKDEELFASKDVYFSGQIIGLIIADSQYNAQMAARKVKIEYEVLPHILTIDDAIIAQSFFGPSKKLERGNVYTGMNSSEHVIEGSVAVGGQNHFCLETQVSLVVPKGEDDEFEVFASTQNPTETQQLVAEVLGTACHKVVCRVKRMGGGFGGKESRSCILSCAVAVAAHKLNRPVRCQLDRNEDMVMCGGRHPFKGHYKIGFNSDGIIQAADVQLYSNGGFSADLSLAVMERAVSHSDNCYFIPNFKVQGTVCKTNIHSNTAFRGFGGPQGMLITETWMTHIANTLKMRPEVIRERNMYKEGQITHFNQKLEMFNVPRLWQECSQKSQFQNRILDIQNFNAQHKHIKRGISLIPTKFGIAFTARFLNQAGALLHIYRDGSILLSHGGTEMGQGLHTKCAQICADALGVEMERIQISETSTDKVANTSPTAASASSDLNGMAVMDACRQINSRLQPLKSKHPSKSFAEIVQIAYFDRINLSANGFYKTPDLNYDWNTNIGDRMFNYFTFGVACSEVEVDILTGDHQVLRTDIIMDIGKSLNPEIDIGQIEGAFVQGIGWCTVEEMHHLQNGSLLTRGPGNYKIPASSDIPIDLRVSLLEQSDNTRAIHSSKAIGEPPLFLGSTVFFAIRDAVCAARLGDHQFQFDSPATSDKIRMACEDIFTKTACLNVKDQNKKEWLVRTS